ncbi:hypothetical protein [Streptomyces sp. NBC_01264]|uniref:hypothetical protein n=1 Tax=Streptomyces sp. NBC_01264 TaxID=2903804 RepID=UPI002252B84F|nr:hypothetical protein [Streptomyces sp. NBC_01264]MCX4784315.1 hypothetical protein [Streptomyces sp. NBC_01264]
MFSVIAWGAAVLVLSTATLAGPAFADEAEGQTGKAKPGAEVFTLNATNTGSTHIPSSQSDGIGNRLLVTANLARDGDVEYGKEATVCTQVTPTVAEVCQGSFRLRDGEISFQHFAPPHTTPPTDFDAAITGGTGAYSTARGYIRTVRTSLDPGGGEHIVHLQR